MKPWYQSQTIRALIVSALAQLFVMLNIEGDAAQIADAILQVVAIGSLVWAGIARKRATQPLSLKGTRDENSQNSGV